MEYRTASGIIVTDTRHHVRGLPTLGGDGRGNPPNETLPGMDNHTVPGGDTYEPISVGPNASEGFGNSHVMHPPGMAPAAWSGWPVEWSVPWAGGGGGYLGQFGRLVDIVYAAVDLNSSIISAMPPYIIKGTDPQPPRGWMTNPEPEIYTSWTAWAKEAMWSLVTCGETFMYATERYTPSAGGKPSRWMNLNPAFVGVDRVAGQIEYRIGGDVVDPADVLHIKYVSWPGDLRGHGPLEVAGARLLAISAMLGYMANQATTGGIPPAILKHPKRLNRAQMHQMQRDWVEARMSAMGLPAVLSDGTELELMNPQLKDATISEAEKFSEARVSTLLGVPPFLMGLPSGDAGTYVNSTNIFDFHWRAYLRPRAQQLVAAMSEWLLEPGEALELNRDEYTRPGMFERSQSYSMLIAAGVISPADVAKLERYPVPDPATTAPATGGNPYMYAAQPTYTAAGRPAGTNTNPN